MERVQPSIKVLNSEQVAHIHDLSLKILDTVGMRVDSSKARDMLVEAGCRVGAERQVFIPRHLVDWALEQAPATVDIHDRKGDPCFTVGRPASHPARFGIGVTNLYYQDPESDRVEPFRRSHLRASVRLANTLNGFDLVSTPGILQDEPPGSADLVSSLEMVANTTKPLVLLVSDGELFEPVLNLLEALHGELSQRPFVIPYFNPITPLVINEETFTKVALAADRGLPIIYSNYGMSGATAPITPASTLALLNAELLAGLVLSQLARPGSAIILGSLPAGFDMKKMMSLYTPHTMLLNLACAEMMSFYDLPHCGTSGSGPGWGPDLLAAGGFWSNYLTACMGKVGLAPFVGGNFDSKVFSPAAVVYADEVIRQARQFAAGFALGESAEVLDELLAVGAGGDFLSSQRTFKLFRSMNYEGNIWPHLPLEQWQARQQPSADSLLRARTRELLDAARPADDHDEILERGCALIEELTPHAR